jgi:hypothetical protein
MGCILYAYVMLSRLPGIFTSYLHLDHMSLLPSPCTSICPATSNSVNIHSRTPSSLRLGESLILPLSYRRHINMASNHAHGHVKIETLCNAISSVSDEYAVNPLKSPAQIAETLYHSNVRLISNPPPSPFEFPY